MRRRGRKRKTKVRGARRAVVNIARDGGIFSRPQLEVLVKLPGPAEKSLQSCRPKLQGGAVCFRRAHPSRVREVGRR